MEKAQDAGLNGAAQVNGLLFERVGQIGHDHVADVAASRVVEDQPESALGVVLANQDDGAMEKGAVQFSAIQKQLPLAGIGGAGHKFNA
jgi:hypothetical protein